MGSSNENGGVPPGFRFHPTDEELLHYYLKKKVSFQKFDMEVIREVDLNKIEPWDLQERCKIGASPQNEWYFFSHKDRKYPTGSRTNRATNAGFWKATGRDKCIRNSLKKIGMRKTLVFYRGRAPHGQKTDWIMHEYRLEDPDDPQQQSNPNVNSEDGWVVCRVFKKKNLIKVGVASGDQASTDDHHLILNGDNHENRYTMMHRDMHSHNHHQEYLLHHQHDHDHMTTHDYMTHIPHNPYSQFQPHNFLPLPSFHKEPLPLTVTYNDFSTLTSKPLISCDEDGVRNDQNLCYQACETGLEVQTNGDTDTSGREDPNLSKWTMVDPHLLTSSQPGFGNDDDASAHNEVNASSMTHINPLAIRGEIELWGYRK